MKFMTYCVAVFTLFTAVACGKKEAAMDDRVRQLESKPIYKCIENLLYQRVSDGSDVWIENGKKCRVGP
jgi:hypothetical protein